MAHSQTKNALTDNFLAGTDVAAYTIVKHSVTDAQTVDQAVDASVYLLGVARCDAVAGKRVDVMETGTSKLIIGADVAAGDLITADANGHGIPATAGDFVIGHVKQAALTGEFATVQINSFKI